MPDVAPVGGNKKIAKLFDKQETRGHLAGLKWITDKSLDQVVVSISELPTTIMINFCIIFMRNHERSELIDFN